MKTILTSILLLIALTTLTAQPPKVSSKFEKELVKHFESEDLNTVEIQEISRFGDIFYNVHVGDKKLGLAVLSSAMGRYEKFDFMIIYNLNLEVELIKILVYRSEYGSEIMAKRWLKQFYTKQTENFVYGSDIQAISGATFSASSLTKNVNRIYKIVSVYNTD